MDPYGHSTSVIANGETVGGAVCTGGFTLLGVEFPAAFTGATITFQGGRSQTGTFQEIVDSAGTAVSITASDGKCVGLTDVQNSQIMAFLYIRPVSASAEAGARDVVFHMK